MDTTNRHPATATVALSDIIDRVLATSEWRKEHDSTLYRLSLDNTRLIALRIHEGFVALRQRMEAYLAGASFNTDPITGSITFNLLLKNPFAASLPGEVAAAATEALANYALMKFYGDIDRHSAKPQPSIDFIAWRRATAQLMLIFARNDMG